MRQFPTAYTTTRILHRGLDAESDVDDGTESTVPRRATPLTARSGTPLARAATPATRANSRSSVSGDGVGRGYTLAKGAISEDVEEEEAEDGKEFLFLWKFSRDKKKLAIPGCLTFLLVFQVTSFLTLLVYMCSKIMNYPLV